MTAMVKEQKEVEIGRSKVLKKMKCPGVADWPDFGVVVPVESMVGTIPSLFITVRDKDWGVGARDENDAERGLCRDIFRAPRLAPFEGVGGSFLETEGASLKISRRLGPTSFSQIRSPSTVLHGS